MALLMENGFKGRRRAAARGEAGFSLMQLILTLAVISIVSSFAFIRITSARDHIRLTNAARDFANYAEPPPAICLQ